jgi:hypothetical protein
MRIPFLLVLVLAQLNWANSQTLILDQSEFDLIQNSTESEQRVKYFVFLDKNDCYNCTLASSRIDQELDSNKVFILSHQISKNVLSDYINTYKLSESFNYVHDDDLFNLIKSKAGNQIKEKSFICEVNSLMLTVIPLKKFVSAKSFGTKIENKKTIINNKGAFISAIPRYAPFKNDFITLTSPKNSIYYFKDDSITQPINLDTVWLKSAFKFIMSQQPDSLHALNTYEKCIATYNSQLKRMGLALVTPQNFTIRGESCYSVVQVYFPIWTSNADVSFTGEIFLLKLNLGVSEIWNVESLTPISKSGSPSGRAVFAYNFMNINEASGLLELGYYLDSSTINDDNEALAHCVYHLENDVYVKGASCKKLPEEIKEEYKLSQNLALIHRNVNENIVQFTYFPVLHVNNEITINLLGETKALYHSYASKIENGMFKDFCSINGKYYVVSYTIEDERFLLDKAIRLESDGIIQSAAVSDGGFDFLVQVDGLYYRNQVKL